MSAAASSSSCGAVSDPDVGGNLALHALSDDSVWSSIQMVSSKPPEKRFSSPSPRSLAVDFAGHSAMFQAMLTHDVSEKAGLSSNDGGYQGPSNICSL